MFSELISYLNYLFYCVLFACFFLSSLHVYMIYMHAPTDVEEIISSTTYFETVTF